MCTTIPIVLSDFRFWNTVLLGLTLLVLIKYTIDTNRLANQAEESSLKPVILRVGFMKCWESIIGSKKEENLFSDGIQMEFLILKNIATGINGYLIKDGFKYKLLFGNNISKIEEGKMSVQENWGWLKEDSKIFALFDEAEKEKSNEPNQIVIRYKDIEGNDYFTIEDKNFSTKSFSGKIEQ